jgi:hypothetical protein
MRRFIILGLSLLALSTPVLAEDVRVFEVTPYGGYRWGGEIDASSTPVFNVNGDIDSAGSYGIRFDFFVWKNLQIELLASRQSTDLVDDQGLFGADTLLSEIDVSYYHAGVIWQWENSRIKPYVGGTFGVARLEIDTPRSSDERFSGSIGGGAKMYFNDHVGVRFDGRFFWTSLDGRGNDCCSNEFTDAMLQGEVSVGLILGF